MTFFLTMHTYIYIMKICSMKITLVCKLLVFLTQFKCIVVCFFRSVCYSVLWDRYSMHTEDFHTLVLMDIQKSQSLASCKRWCHLKKLWGKKNKIHLISTLWSWDVPHNMCPILHNISKNH